MFEFKGYVPNGVIAIIMAIILVPFMASCSQTKGTKKIEDDEFVVHIQNSEDVQKLKQVETILTVTPEKAMAHPDYQVVENVSVPFVPEYRMGPGDVVEIVYHIRHDQLVPEYKMEVQDKISVQFPFHPQFSSTVLLRTDGKVTLPLIGDVHAEGLRPEELAATLNQRYENYLADPAITVTLEEFDVKIAELKRAITTAPRGQSKIAPVTPDGRISFPIIGTMQAQGFSVNQLEKLVNEKYKTFVGNLHATIILLEIHQPRLYVLGEVANPGVYDIHGQLNMLDALALSGGSLGSANLEEIVVFRNEGLEKPIAFKVDLESALKDGNIHANLRVKPADIIIVPKTGLDAFNDLMEKIFTRGVYTILPFTTDYNWNYRIDGRSALQ